MNLLIVEDEQRGYERLVKLLKEAGYDITICGPSTSIKSTVRWLVNNPLPDLIFMDIELADGECFEIFNKIEILIPIIFTASHDVYALRALKVNCVDYLLKPIEKEELENSLKKFFRLRQQNDRANLPLSIETLFKDLKQISSKKNYRHRFLVKQGQRLVSIEVRDIAWFHADGKICFMKVWKNHRYLLDYTLDELIELLDPELYYRVNRSYIVHIKSIKNINPFLNGRLALQLCPVEEGKNVIISKEKAAEFKQWLGK